MILYIYVVEYSTKSLFTIFYFSIFFAPFFCRVHFVYNISASFSSPRSVREQRNCVKKKHVQTVTHAGPFAVSLFITCSIFCSVFDPISCQDDDAFLFIPFVEHIFKFCLLFSSLFLFLEFMNFYRFKYVCMRGDTSVSVFSLLYWSGWHVHVKWHFYQLCFCFERTTNENDRFFFFWFQFVINESFWKEAREVIVTEPVKSSTKVSCHGLNVRFIFIIY